MEKKIIRVFGKRYLLLGKGQNGKKYYLQAPSWDCGWYWGLGYINSFTNNATPEKSKDIASHQHFDNIFLKKGDYIDNFKNFFSELSIGDISIWNKDLRQLLDLMKSAYLLRESAELFCRGGASISENSLKNELKNSDYYKNICKNLLPAIFAKIGEILGDDKTKEYYSNLCVIGD